jgi:GntR family transcriptional regulator
MNTREKDKKTSAEPGISYRTPIYLQLREIIRNKIEDGEYPPGTAIPSEHELAETYGINRITVRNAMTALVHEGILVRVKGKGVFVVGKKLEQSIEDLGGFIPSFSQGREIISTTVKEQSKILRPAGDKYKHIFNLDDSDLIYYIRQLILTGGEPIMLEEIYVPEKVIPRLDTVNSSVFSLSDIFAFYSIHIVEVQQNLEITKPNKKLQQRLHIPDGVAVMMVETTRTEKNGQVVAYNKTYTRSDKISFSVQLHDTET